MEEAAEGGGEAVEEGGFMKSNVLWVAAAGGAGNMEPKSSDAPAGGRAEAEVGGEGKMPEEAGAGN